MDALEAGATPEQVAKIVELFVQFAVERDLYYRKQMAESGEKAQIFKTIGEERGTRLQDAMLICEILGLDFDAVIEDAAASRLAAMRDADLAAGRNIAMWDSRWQIDRQALREIIEDQC